MQIQTSVDSTNDDLVQLSSSSWQLQVDTTTTSVLGYTAVRTVDAPTTITSSNALLSVCDDGAWRHVSSGTCIECARGSYCVNGSMYSCPRGTYNPMTGQSSCQDCAAGTYSDAQVGRQTPCAACPRDFYCENATVAKACPENTVSPEASQRLQDCTCMAGYECSYQKVLTFRILYNASGEEGVSDFANNAGLIAQFKTQIASTCKVDASKVTLLGVHKVEVAA